MQRFIERSACRFIEAIECAWCQWRAISASPNGRHVNSWNLNRAGEIKGNAPPTDYYRGLCVLGDDVLICVETSRWEWSPVDSFIGGFRFVCCGRLRILHDLRMGENSKRSDQTRHLRDRSS